LDVIRGLGLSGIGVDLHETGDQDFHDHNDPLDTRLLRLVLENAGTVENAY
jgi:hypothetical protein